MKNQRLLIFLLLGAYIFSPSLLTWVIDPNGAWYRPYIIWALMIVAAYLFQRNQRKPDQ
jgi:hypothetical protein